MIESASEPLTADFRVGYHSLNPVARAHEGGKSRSLRWSADAEDSPLKAGGDRLEILVAQDRIADFIPGIAKSLEKDLTRMARMSSWGKTGERCPFRHRRNGRATCRSEVSGRHRQRAS